jgi:hypothetical protein
LIGNLDKLIGEKLIYCFFLHKYTLIASCYIYHFKKTLDRLLNHRSADARIFIKNIATKSATRSEKIENVIASVNVFTSAFNMDFFGNDRIFVDFCVGATVKSDADYGKV